MFRRLAALLRKPLFGIMVISPDASVDPSSFSEQEYPVYCPSCRYLLRGLPDGKCPECGEPFERGRLLVRQYVVEWQGAEWKHSTAGKWCGRLLNLALATWVLIVLGTLGISFFPDYLLRIMMPSPSAGTGWPVWALRILAAIPYSLVLMYLIAFGIAFRTYPRGVRKRRRAIKRAIRQARGARPSSEEARAT